MWLKMHILKMYTGPGQVAWLVGASSQYAKVASLTPGQSTYENKPMSAMNGWNNKSMSVCLSLLFSLSKINLKCRQQSRYVIITFLTIQRIYTELVERDVRCKGTVPSLEELAMVR